MFKIYLLSSGVPVELYNDISIYESVVLNPELEFNGDNGILIGKLTFRLHNPDFEYDLRLLQNLVVVTQMLNDVETVIFRGRPLLRDDTEDNDNDFTFEGILACLNDTIQPPSIKKWITFYGYYEHFKSLINYHNSLVGSASNRQFDISKISGTDSACYMSELITIPGTTFFRYRASTMDHLKVQYVEERGGYFFVENEPFIVAPDGRVTLHNYIRYIDIYSPTKAHVNSQHVEFGKNLISIKRSVSAEDFATVLVPLGDTIPEANRAWPYYQSTGEGGGWKIRKITNSPDNYELINYSSSGAYINAETGKEESVGNQNYRMPPDVNVEPGEIFFLTTYLEGFSTEISAATYAILSRDGKTLYSVGQSVRNTKDQNGNVEVKTIALADERIEIPKDVTGVGLKLRLSRLASTNDPNPSFVLKKLNPNYAEENVTIMSGPIVSTGSVRKHSRFDIGRDVYPDATDPETAPETYEESKKLYHQELFSIFGPIEKNIEFSGYKYEHVEQLQERAQKELEKMGEDLEIEIEAADLGYIDEHEELFHPYDLVPVISIPHRIDLMLPIVKMTLPLADPAAATYTLQNDIHLSQDNKKYISQMVSSPSANQRPTTTVYIGGGSGGGGGGSGDAENAVLYVMQDLLESQKAQARANIGAVAAVAGKGLSSNDYTTAEKNKLAGIAAGAEPNVQPDWNQTDTSADDYIKNKPTIPDSGVMSVNGYSGPTITLVTSDLTNDSGYITLNDVPQEVPTADASANGMVLGVDNGHYTFVRMTGGISDVYMDGASIVQSGTTTAVIPNANTTRFGVVKLYDGSDSTSTSLVPTANALRGVAQRVGNLETRSANWRTETQIKALIADAILDYQNELATLDRYANVVVAQSKDDFINLLSVPSASVVFNSNPYKFGYVMYNTKTVSGGGSSADIYEFQRGYIVCVYRGDSYEVTISGVTYYFQYVFLKYPTFEPLGAYNWEDVEFYSGTVVSGTALEQAQQDAEDFIAYLESQP